MDRKAVDWAPPTTFGLDNSVRLADQVNDLAGAENSGRVFTTRKDLKTMAEEDEKEGKNKPKSYEVNSDDEDDDGSNGGSDEEEAPLYGSFIHTLDIIISLVRCTALTTWL
jgi:hypothetical protein